MAPIKSKRPSIRSRALARSSSSTAAPGHEKSQSLPSTKKDRRLVKHSAFVSKIEKSSGKSRKKRRRPAKQLVTSLQSLADALPESGAGDDDTTEVGQAKIKHRSLKSRPGALKRKEKLERSERDRFGKNMAQLFGKKESQPAQKSEPHDMSAKSSTKDRWAALRGFISQTMEQKPEFRNAKADSAMG